MNQDNWAGWISAIGAGVIIIVTFLKSFFVTHAQMREFFKDRDEERQRWHKENKADLRAIVSDMTEVKGAVRRLEGQLSGRYPRIEG